MSIISVKTIQTGLVGVIPSVAYIDTSSTIAEMQVTGYLNNIVKNGGVSFQMPCMAVVSTKETPTSQPQVGWYAISHVGDNWSITIDSSGGGGVEVPTTLNHIATFKNTAGKIGQDSATAINFGNIQAGGVAGTAGLFRSYPSDPIYGHFDFKASPSLGPAVIIVTNADHNQDSTYTVPDTGAVAANFLMSEGTAAKASITTLRTGSENLALVDPANCEIQIVAGATNTALIFIQLRDGAGASVTRNVPFTIYASQLANGMLVAAPASTGFSLSGSGVVLINGASVTTQISGVTSDSGQCVLALLDTAKQTSWIVLALGNGIKISDRMTAGSYG